MAGIPAASSTSPPPGTPGGAPVRTGLILLVVSAAVFLASLDLFIVNIAFPAIGSDFSADPADLSWVLNAYTIGFAALLAPAGRAADRIGRRRVFLAGLAVFVVASLGCATAWDVASLTGFRVLQAVGAALITSTSLALLLHSFPPARRAHAIAVWSAIGGVAAALGPPIGGLLVEASWRWVFLVNAPVGIAALIVGLRVLPESRDETEDRRPDTVGSGLLIAGVALLAWAMVDAPDHGWSSGVTAGRAGVAVLLLVAAVARAARTPRRLVPVLPLQLLRTRTFALTCLAGLAFFAAFGAMLLGNVLWLTGGWGMSALEAGLLLAPGPAFAAAFAVPGGRLGARYGCGQVAAVGMLLFTVGALWWLWRVDVEQEYVTAMLPGLLLSGMGVGLTLTNLSAAVSSTLPPPVLATGTATFAAARQLGATFGVALLLGLGSGGRDALDSAQRGWLLVVVVTGLAGVTALLVGRADHPDLAVTKR
jgi:EmrB/QacA subfamily drug resistance transporter